MFGGQAPTGPRVSELPVWTLSDGGWGYFSGKSEEK